MPRTKDLENMTLDELIEHRVGQKAEINKLREDYAASHEVYAKKVLQFHIDEAVKQAKRAADESGRSLQEQVQEWVENGDAGQRKQANLIAANSDSLPKGE